MVRLRLGCLETMLRAVVKGENARLKDLRRNDDEKHFRLTDRGDVAVALELALLGPCAVVPDDDVCLQRC